jgi:hypothetical protein
MKESIHELRISKNIEELRLQLDLLEEIIIDMDRKLDDIIAPAIESDIEAKEDAILMKRARYPVAQDSEHEKHEKDKRLRTLDKVTYPHGRVPGGYDRVLGR